jgi:hypothetical protein
MEKVFKFFGVLAVCFLAVFYRMFVFTKVWELTVVPLGAPQIGLMQAWGLSFAFSIFLPIDSKAEDLKKKMQDLASGMLSITILWGLAALIF